MKVEVKLCIEVVLDKDVVGIEVCFEKIVDVVLSFVVEDF